ncbi:hypothetical protein D1AOALGA4SA_588 [Olavius algarvensis Delta 1 endosymbiont]|nr:hypothetical protein D1AOALGA4SA_588 [Olavius algarvensis Delta 1 endosymbiont]
MFCLHWKAHCPQPIHLSLLKETCSSFNFIAAVGQNFSQLPHPLQLASSLTIEWTHKRKNSHYISMIR